MKKLSLFFMILLFLSINLFSQDRNVKVVPDKVFNPNQKTALVIGNSAYLNSPLINPVNDASDMEQALTACGFKVDLLVNANSSSIKNAIRNFGNMLQNGGIGLFYYAGHGVQVNGKNYLIPVEAEIQRAYEIEDEAVGVHRVLAEMTLAQNSMNIIILDACRNNPFVGKFRSPQRGLASMEAPKGTIIAYATAPGDVAEDGTGRNGLYTQELLKQLKVQGLKIEDVFKKVRVAVENRSNGSQVPWEHSSLTGDFYFRPPAGTPEKDIPQDKSPDDSELQLPKPIFRFIPIPINIGPVYEMVQKNNFYSANTNNSGFTNKFKQRGEVIIDYASGLFWQQSGSKTKLTLKQADEYIASLNNDLFGGYSGWRLPTLEEAFSLLKPNRNRHGLHIHEIFDQAQQIIITSDFSADINNKFQWVVSFDLAIAGGIRDEDAAFVRAVR